MSKELTLKITMVNAAFFNDGNDGREEVARILGRAAEKILEGQDRGRLHDINGNKVGEFDITE